MRTRGTVVLSLSLLVVAPAAQAQDAGKIFDFLQNQIQNEVNRKQQRQFERNQRQQLEAQHEEFLSAWRHCFDTDDVIRCDVALAHPYLNDVDRQRLLTKRAQLIAFQEQAERAARQQQYEHEERARQAAEAEAQRRENERAAALEREQRTREAAEADARRREYERKLTEERERAEQARAREAVAQKAAERRTYDNDLAACKSFNTYSCDRAGLSPLATDQERASVAAWRQTAATYVAVRENCKNGMLAACEVALASPALTAAERPQIEEWRVAASPLLRFRAAVSRFGNSTLATTQAAAISFRDLPVSTHIMTVIAAALAMTLGFVAVRQRPRASPEAKVEPALAPAASATDPEPAAAVKPATVTSPTTSAAVRNLPVAVAAPEPEPASSLPRDTPAALRALKLAASYLSDVPEDSSFAEEDDAKSARTTLALAAKQLDIAYRADPSAALGDDEDRMAQHELRAMVLQRESQSWFPHNQAKAIRIIGQAKATCPEAAGLWFWSGWYNFQQRNRPEAIDDFQRALELDPDHIEALKYLDRAQNMGGGEIALFRVANARDRTLIGAEKTFKVLRIPFLIVTLPLRVVYFFGRLIFVAWRDPWRAARGDF